MTIIDQSVRLVLPQGGEQEEEEPAEFGQEEGAQDEARDVTGARGHLLLRRLLGALGTLVQKRLGKALRANGLLIRTPGKSPNFPGLFEHKAIFADFRPNLTMPKKMKAKTRVLRSLPTVPDLTQLRLPPP